MFGGLACKTHIAHIAHIARTRGRGEVLAHIAYSKEPGDCGGSAAWRTRGTVPQQIGLSALSAVGGRLVRPAFDLVLRRIQSLKRCVQAYGCKIVTPDMRRNLAPGCISSDVPKETPFPCFFGTPPLVFFFLFFLSPAKVGSLEMQPGAKLQAFRGHYFAAIRLHAAF